MAIAAAAAEPNRVEPNRTKPSQQNIFTWTTRKYTPDEHKNAQVNLFIGLQAVYFNAVCYFFFGKMNAFTEAAFQCRRSIYKQKR